MEAAIYHNRVLGAGEIVPRGKIPKKKLISGELKAHTNFIVSNGKSAFGWVVACSTAYPATTLLTWPLCKTPIDTYEFPF